MAAAQVYLQEVFKLSVDELGMCLAFQVLWSFILNTFCYEIFLLYNAIK